MIILLYRKKIHTVVNKIQWRSIMKIQRPGNTESHLLFSNFLKTKYPTEYSEELENFFIQWLYTTSGFYDKNINPNNFAQVSESKCYHRLLKEYEQSLYNCDYIECYYGNPSFFDTTPELLNEYLKQFQPLSLSLNAKYIYNHSDVNFLQYWSLEYRETNVYNGVFHRHYDLLKQKSVLVISAFSELIEYQYKYNVKNIFTNFPSFDLITYTTPYTFVNNGPHADFFETLDEIWSNIYNLNFDIALLSCGIYAALLIDKIHQTKNKDAIYMGRGCNYMFGIDPMRNQEDFPNWIIDIPKKHIPTCYKQIEDGMYWEKNHV